MKYDIELFRDGQKISGPTPYEGEIDIAKSLALKQGRANNANFVRILESGTNVEFWSEHLDA